MTDLTNLENLDLYTPFDAFKNNALYTGSFQISGTTTSGTNTRTNVIHLGVVPDTADIVFNGAADPALSDLRPAAAWFKQGAVYVLGTDVPAGYTDEPTAWILHGSINGSNLTVTAVNTQQFVATLALTASTVYYRVVDYSVF